MNLFISDNFIDTVGQKVNVLQLIRQVTEDDDLLHVEVMGELAEMFDYSTVNALEDGINDGEFEDLALQDDTLYVGGQVLKDLFEVLFTGDYTSVIETLVASIQSATSVTLRLDHNGSPVVPVERTEEQQSIDFSNLAHVEVRQHDYVAPSSGTQQSIADPVPDGHVITAINDQMVTVRPVEPFPGNQAGPEVLQSEVAAVDFSAPAALPLEVTLGLLRFNGKVIGTAFPSGYNDVLFSVSDLYHHIYGLQTNPDYIQQILVQNSLSFNANSVHVRNGEVFVSLRALAVIHQIIAPCVEWYPMITRVTQSYSNNPHFDTDFDLLGN